MTIETLTRAHTARPFRPFALRMADGRSISIPRPESLAFNGRGQTAVAIDEGDGFEIIDLLLVVTLSFKGEPIAS